MQAGAGFSDPIRRGSGLRWENATVARPAWTQPSAYLAMAEDAVSARMQDVLAGLRDPEWEPALDAMRETLAQLNEVVARVGEPLEGNLFYHHRASLPLPPEPDPSRRHKRRNFALYAATGDSLLEIGFNAGHSALLALAADPGLRYCGIDVATHAYTRPCFEVLRRRFGERVELREGDSRVVLPRLREAGRRFALFHIDGGHGLDNAQADLRHVLALARPGQVLLMDDVHDPALDALVDWHCVRGDVSRLALSRLWAGTEQVLLRAERAGWPQA